MSEQTPPVMEHSYSVAEPLDGREMLIPLRSLIRRQALDELCRTTPCVADSEADITISLRRERSSFGELLVATATALCSEPNCLRAAR